MAMAVPGQHGCVLDSEQMRYRFFLVAVLKAWLQELELLRAEMEAARRGAAEAREALSQPGALGLEEPREVLPWMLSVSQRRGRRSSASCCSRGHGGVTILETSGNSMESCDT